MSTYYTIMSMIDGFKSFINLAVMVLTIVASWIMYAKAGEHGWAAIVPFYSSYVKFRIAGKQKLFWGYLVASIASIAGCILLMYEIIASGLSVMTSSYMGSYYDSTYGYAGNRIGAHMGMLIFAVILIIGAMIAALVMNILCCVGLAHAFGKGAGFACGLIFLNVIFICIIAFNKNIVYVGDGYNSNNNYYNPYGSNGYDIYRAVCYHKLFHDSPEHQKSTLLQIFKPQGMSLVKLSRKLIIYRYRSLYDLWEK